MRTQTIQMYTEAFVAASYVLFRWNSLESDITMAKRFVTHFAIPFALAALHKAKDACCSRAPKPGMRPPALPPRVQPQTNDSNHEGASQEKVSD